MPRQFQFHAPTAAELDALIADQQGKPLTYDRQTAPNSPRFDHDDNRVWLGSGDAVFAAAKVAMQNWAMFPGDWARIYHQNPQFTEGEVVVMCARIFGIWWLNAARILYVVDERDRFGFAYGTLPNHVESGEELFQIERDTVDEGNPDSFGMGSVYFRLKAFSHPRYWMLRLTYPLPRVFQRRFIRASFENMKKQTAQNLLVAQQKV